MKTKHLLYTLALAAGFSACTSEELIPNAPQLNNGTGGERPELENVSIELNIDETRLSYEGGWVFDSGDEFSALLMDENNTGVRYGVTTETDKWRKLSWLERYHLVDYVHTNYPFTLTQDNKLDAGTNMLEGNYFLVYPYLEELNGERQIIKDISVQYVKGDLLNSYEDRRAVYAANQFMVGYAQLNADKGVSQVNAELYPVLTPVRINIQSNTNVKTTLEVTKVVLSHPNLPGVLTIDPTRAYYGYGAKDDPVYGPKSWNLNFWSKKDDWTINTWMTSGTHFNYANYLGAQPATAEKKDWKSELYGYANYGSTNKMDYVYNINGEVGYTGDKRSDRKPKTYYCDDAIRSIVQSMDEKNNPEYATKFIEVHMSTDGTTDCVPLSIGGTIETIVMMPEFELDEEPLKLTIYTKQGIIEVDDISDELGNESDDVNGTGYISAIDPAGGAIEKITVSIDNTAIKETPAEVTINNEDDLMKWVTWLNNKAQTASKFEAYAKFTNDITIDKNLAAAIESLPSGFNLHIEAAAGTANNNNLRFATPEEHANILEYLDIESTVTVEILDGGVLNMTEKSYNVKHTFTNPDAEHGRLNIEIAKGGTLNIISNDKSAIQGGYNVNGIQQENRTEVTILNKLGGELNVTGVTEVVGFYIENAGVMNIKKGASLYFAPNTNKDDENNEIEVKSVSENTISGQIFVEGMISGTTSNNFKNFGEIYQNGVVKNIQNEKNLRDLNGFPKPGLKDGIIYIGSNKNAEGENVVISTDLTSNNGTVDYQNNLIAIIKNNTLGDYYGGRFLYTGEGVTISALENAFVTEATINSGTMTVGNSKPGSLWKLVLDGSAEKVTISGGDLFFNRTDFAWGELKMIADVVVDGVVFRNIRPDGLKDKQGKEMQNAVISGRDITFTGENAFYTEQQEVTRIKRNDEGEVVTEKTSKYTGDATLTFVCDESGEKVVVNNIAAMTKYVQLIGEDGDPMWKDGKPVYVQLEEKKDQYGQIIQAKGDKPVEGDPVVLLGPDGKEVYWEVKVVTETVKKNIPVTLFLDECNLINEGAEFFAKALKAVRDGSSSDVQNTNGTINLFDVTKSETITVHGNEVVEVEEILE